MKATKLNEILRVALLTIAVQVPVFFVLLKLTASGGCEKRWSFMDQRLTLDDTSNSTALEVNMESSPVLRNDHSLSPASPVPPIIEPKRPTFKPMNDASYPFVRYSAYRHSLETLYVLGLTSWVLRKNEDDRPVQSCEWLPRNGSKILYDRRISTDTQLIYIRYDEHAMPYVPMIINCTFNQPVGANGSGGLLRLVTSVTKDWDTYTVSEDAFEELPGEVVSIPSADDESRLPLKYAYCSPPILGTNNTDWIQSWLVYHHYLWGGEAHFFFYDVGGISAATRRVLEPWMKVGLLTIFDVTEEGAYPGWWGNQVLFMNDCIYRNRFTARWIFFHDLDEVLHVAEPKTLEGLLEENADAPWISFGSWPFSVSHCRTSSEWPMARLLWRHRQPECTEVKEPPFLCPSHLGRRKMVLNPRKVFASGIHRTYLPEHGGVVVHASVARVNHYQGVLKEGSGPCGINITMWQDGNEDGPDGYDFDDTVASLIPKAREFAQEVLKLLPPAEA